MMSMHLVETKKTTDITDISNQSSKEGIRIVIELKKGADSENLPESSVQKDPSGRYVWREYAGSSQWTTGDHGT